MTSFQSFRLSVLLSILLGGFGFLDAQSTPEVNPFYYPLNAGDRWMYNSYITKAIKDTVMPNGKKYTLLFPSHASLGAPRYERYDNSRVYRYNTTLNTEECWFDFTKKPGDTVSVIVRPTSTLVITYDGKNSNDFLSAARETWMFSVTAKNYIDDDFLMICDSIGIVLYGILTMETPAGIHEAVIDGKHYSSTKQSFTMPMQIGNYWMTSLGNVRIDTSIVMPNGKTYFSFMPYPDNSFFGHQYLRQENGIVWRYAGEGKPELIEMDFFSGAGEQFDLQTYQRNAKTESIVRTSLGTKIQNIFSVDRKEYRYSVDYLAYFDDEKYYWCADNFGFTRVGDWQFSFPVTTASVNGKFYTTVSVEPMSAVQIKEFSLQQNHPNPFNPSTSIDYTLFGPEEGTGAVKVRLEIVDVLGRIIETLVDSEQTPGQHSVVWDASRHVSGVYFAKLQSGGSVRLMKMLFVK